MKTVNQHEVYVSECGAYLCRRLGPIARFEVWTRDGARHWRDDNRIRSWKDAALPRHPMEFCVGGYSAEITGQKPRSFSLTLLHCDITKTVIPWQGNSVLESLTIVFRRKIPPQNVPRWIQEGNEYGSIFPLTSAARSLP